MLQLKNVNKRIQDEVSHHIELVAGDGYFYFTFDNSVNFFDSGEFQLTAYVNKLNHLPLDRWIENAKDFLEAVEKKIKEISDTEYVFETKKPMKIEELERVCEEQKNLIDLIREEAEKSNAPLGRSDSLALERIRMILDLPRFGK